MENYTRVIGATSTNIRTPTTPEINQGNDALTPFDSAKNNGYSNEMSQQISNISAELINLIEEAGLTPDGTLTQVKEAIDLAIGDVVAPATETVAGIAEIANQAETDAGSDDTRIVTPQKLRYGFAASFAANGYVAFPSWLGSLIIQWGVNTSNATVNFPISFTTACYNVVATDTSDEISINNHHVYVNTLTVSNFNLRNTRRSSSTYWFATGK